jgi:arylsulfatase
MDIMPTALQAAGLAQPDAIDGRSLLPLAQGKAPKIREHLLLSGIHSRAWGYTGETTIGAPANARREESPGAWVITDGTYLLRFTGAIIPGLYRDVPEGVPAHHELYDLREDPGETRDLAKQLPAVVERLRKRYEADARTWPAPPVWRRDRWAELLPERK